MAAHRLPPKQRKLAILLGGGAAIVLRIVLTLIAALLLQLSGLQLVGGILLIWIGFKLLASEGDEGQGDVKVAHSMKDAVFTILLADFIMSLDNVLGVAAASQGHIPLLMFGLVFSMAILMFMGNLVAELINKFAWLAYIGAGVIVWTGAHMAFKDPFVKNRIEADAVLMYAVVVLVTVGTLAFAHWFHRVREKE